MFLLSRGFEVVGDWSNRILDLTDVVGDFVCDFLGDLRISVREGDLEADDLDPALDLFLPSSLCTSFTLLELILVDKALIPLVA